MVWTVTMKLLAGNKNMKRIKLQVVFKQSKGFTITIKKVGGAR